MVVSLLVIAIIPLSHAQEISGALNFNVGVPIGGFRSEAGGVLLPQVGAEGLYHMEGTAIHLGFDVG